MGPRRTERTTGDRRRRVLALAAAPGVLATMLPAMRSASRRLGRERGYVAGFAAYWIVWCLAVPLALVGPRRLWARMHMPSRRPRGAEWAVLALGPVGAAATIAARSRDDAGPRLLAGAAAVGALNGTAEELLWRGIFVELFEDRCGAVAWPAAWFALWHIAPQAIVSSEHPFRFLLEAAVVGAAWGEMARRGGGLRWTIASHVLTDAADLESPIARLLAGAR